LEGQKVSEVENRPSKRKPCDISKPKIPLGMSWFDPSRLSQAVRFLKYVGPQTRTLEKIKPSMEFEPFVRAAFASLGGIVNDIAPGVLPVSSKGAPNSYASQRVPGQITQRCRSIGRVAPLFLASSIALRPLAFMKFQDSDHEPRQRIEELVDEWVSRFKGTKPEVAIQSAERRFEGNAIARVRATTAHDSYERIVTIACNPIEHTQSTTALDVMPDLLQQPAAAGLNSNLVLNEANRDPNIVEFNRFYLERRDAELGSARKDARKRKKPEDEFTPQIDTTLVALDGQVSRRVNLKVRYQLDGASYESDLVITPSDDRIDTAPVLER
jgi:hypothetical protein